jgi:hypothetical protein
MSEKTSRKLRQYNRVARRDPEMIQAVTGVLPRALPKQKLKDFWRRMNHMQRGSFRLRVIDRVI